MKWLRRLFSRRPNLTERQKDVLLQVNEQIKTVGVVRWIDHDSMRAFLALKEAGLITYDWLSGAGLTPEGLDEEIAIRNEREKATTDRWTRTP